MPLYVALCAEGILFMKTKRSDVSDVCVRCRQAALQQQSLSKRRRMCRRR